jgi:hypothetical protein
MVGAPIASRDEAEEGHRFGGQRLEKDALGVIWQVWSELRGHFGNGRLPLSSSNFDEDDGWKGYIPLLFKMLQDIDEASGLKESAEEDLPMMSWARYPAPCRMDDSSVLSDQLICQAAGARDQEGDDASAACEEKPWQEKAVAEENGEDSGAGS